MFPSMKARALLRVLMREPLRYRIVRARGSHRVLRSSAGYPEVLFAFHDGATISPGIVRTILVKDIGLDAVEALAIVRRKR